jgi:hypothetical protein
MRQCCLRRRRASSRQSCGCLQSETIKNITTTHGCSSSNDPKLRAFYECWLGMRRRCNNKQDRYYGGRGIVYDSLWNDFAAFKEEMYNSYEHGLTLDRIKVNQGYSKENCRWATRSEQATNKRCSVWIAYRGKRLRLASYYRRHVQKAEVSYTVFAGRLLQPSSHKWTPKEALITPLLIQRKKHG